MMIKCQKCGYENQMGSIFCRKCGVKLDMNALDPKLLKQNAKKDQGKKKAKKFAKNLIINIVVLLVLGVFLGSIFYNGGLPTYSHPNYKIEDLNKKLKVLEDGSRKATVKLSAAELTGLMQERIKPMIIATSSARIENIEVTLDGDTVIAYVWLRLFDFTTLTYTIKGTPKFHVRPEFHPQFKGQEPPPYDPITFEFGTLTIGRLPVFVRRDLFMGPINGLLNNDQIKYLAEYLDDLEIISGEGIQVKSHQKPKEEEE